MMDKGGNDETVAWAMTDKLVSGAQSVFLPVWEQTKGNDGYVSFELDPLLEDLQLAPQIDGRAHPALHRAGQEMGRGAQEPHDQGSGDARRAGRA